MSRSLLLVAAALALAAPATAATSAARLRVQDTAPPTIRGTGFHGGERVTVTASAGDRFTKVVTASIAGGFVVRFARAHVDPCKGFAVTARGSDGSRASYKTPPHDCPPIQPLGP